MYHTFIELELYPFYKIVMVFFKNKKSLKLYIKNMKRNKVTLFFKKRLPDTVYWGKCCGQNVSLTRIVFLTRWIK